MAFLTTEIGAKIGTEISEIVYIDNMPKKSGVYIKDISNSNSFQTEISEYVLEVRVRVAFKDTESGFTKAKTIREYLHKKTGGDLGLSSYDIAVIRCLDIQKEKIDLSKTYEYIIILTLKTKDK